MAEQYLSFSKEELINTVVTKYEHRRMLVRDAAQGYDGLIERHPCGHYAERYARLSAEIEALNAEIRLREDAERLALRRGEEEE